MAASLVVAVAGVIGWVVLAETVHVRTALVGFAVAVGTTNAFRRYAPRDSRGPIAVVGWTIGGAALGLLASQYALLAQTSHISYLTALTHVPVSRVPRLFTIGTDPLTWIIVAASGYSGYRQSRRLLTSAQNGSAVEGVARDRFNHQQRLQADAFAELS